MTAAETIAHRQRIIAAQVCEIGRCAAHLADLRALYGHECPAPDAGTLETMRKIKAELDYWVEYKGPENV